MIMERISPPSPLLCSSNIVMSSFYICSCLSANVHRPPGFKGEKIGFNSEQGSDLQDVQPKFSGTNAKGNATLAIYDATIEEWLHFITDHGLVKAYPKIFGTKYSSNSTLTNAMDIAR